MEKKPKKPSQLNEGHVKGTFGSVKQKITIVQTVPPPAPKPKPKNNNQS